MGMIKSSYVQEIGFSFFLAKRRGDDFNSFRVFFGDMKQ